MNSKRLYQALAVSLILMGLLSVASAYYGQKMLSERSSELNQLKVKTSALEQQERSLIQAKQEIEEYTLLESVARSIVPQEKDQARTIRELVTIAQSVGVNISGITFPSSELGSEKSKTQDQSKTQLKKVDGIPGLSQLELTIAINESIDYGTLINFLERLENNRRTSAISSIQIAPSEDEFQIGLTILVYIKP